MGVTVCCKKDHLSVMSNNVYHYADSMSRNDYMEEHKTDRNDEWHEVTENKFTNCFI